MRAGRKVVGSEDVNVADTIAELLVARGITHAFGIVGGGNATLFDALYRRLTLVCVHHEQAAAMAATYYYRVCGKLAPVVVTSGAGSANAITGVMAAYMDSIPLLVLSGNEKLAHIDGRTRILGLQGFDSSAVASHFTKHSDRLRNPEYAELVIETAIRVALEHRQGPVWVDVPKDIQNAAV